MVVVQVMLFSCLETTTAADVVAAAAANEKLHKCSIFAFRPTPQKGKVVARCSCQ
jgi:hypothetical protein